MEKYVDCHNCQNQYDCEKTYLGGCTDGKEWEQDEKKLMDEEVVKALECCSQNETECTCAYCRGCPASDWDSEDDWQCNADMMKKAIDIIHRLQKELEEKDQARLRWGKLFIQRNREIKELKKEKEDLEKRLKERIFKYRDLRAENERLTEENGQLEERNRILKKYKSMWAELDTKNAELQKQVDELKAYAEYIYKKAVDREEDAYSFGIDKGKEQSVKDTAKEILQELYYEFDRIGDEGSCGEIRLMAERYGVEVE